MALRPQDDHKAYRRQLEDKRIVIEKSLLSGRQYASREQKKIAEAALNNEGTRLRLC